MTDRFVPVIGITMGCPVSVGPEVIIRLFHALQMSTTFKAFVIGDLGVLRKCAAELGVELNFQAWQPGADLSGRIVHVYNVTDLGPHLTWGRPNSTTGKAMAAYIEEAVRLIEDKVMDAMVTCPIAKQTLNAAGFDYPGHTEMLASMTQAGEFGMMLAGESLRVTLVTIHAGMSKVPAMITKEAVVKTIHLTGKSLQRDFGIAKPRIAVAGLNPHAGEEGMFGDEEIREIIPAIGQAMTGGWDAVGPFPPDTVFNKAVAGEYDAVVCMYHDQGLIPFKLLHFDDGVNVTMGLPIVRTSVDHGTAYDIAGKGIAKPSSLHAAVYMAAAIAVNRRKIDR